MRGRCTGRAPPTPPVASSWAKSNPLDEKVYDSHVGNLFGPISRIRDAYGWASESFAQEKFRAADFPAWQRAMREVVFEAMKHPPGKRDFDVDGR